MLLPFVREIFAEVELLPAFTRAASHLRESAGRIRVTGLSPGSQSVDCGFVAADGGASVCAGGGRQSRRGRIAAGVARVLRVDGRTHHRQDKGAGELRSEMTCSRVCKKQAPYVITLQNFIRMYTFISIYFKILKDMPLSIFDYPHGVLNMPTPPAIASLSDGFEQGSIKIFEIYLNIYLFD